MSSCQWKYSSTQTKPNPTFYRHGAGAARRAHNPEVTRSKRVVGIFIHSHRCIKALRALSKNTQDQQNTYRCSSEAERLKTSFAIFLTLTSPFCEWLSPYKRKVTGSKPVAGNISIWSFYRNAPHTHAFKTSLAQRQSARLITARSGGSKPLGGILQFACFTETGRQAGRKT